MKLNSSVRESPPCNLHFTPGIIDVASPALVERDLPHGSYSTAHRRGWAAKSSLVHDTPPTTHIELDITAESSKLIHSEAYLSFVHFICSHADF